MKLHDREVELRMSSQTFNDFQMNAYRKGVGVLVNQLAEVLSGRLPVTSFILEDSDSMPDDVKKQLKTILLCLAHNAPKK